MLSQHLEAKYMTKQQQQQQQASIKMIYFYACKSGKMMAQN